jgi:hypothetical protein
MVGLLVEEARDALPLPNHPQCERDVRLVISTSPHTPIPTAAASAGHLHEMDVGRAAVARLLTLAPRLNRSNLRWFFPIQRDADYSRWEAGLTAVGLPK